MKVTFYWLIRFYITREYHYLASLDQDPANYLGVMPTLERKDSSPTLGTPFIHGASAMTEIKAAADTEFSAMHTLYMALEPLDDDGRSRVINYIVDRLEISVRSTATPRLDTAALAEGGEEVAIKEEEKSAPKFSVFAELYDAAQPNSNADKALVAGYWLQICQGGENFDSQSANKELKNLGQGLANITNAIDTLKNQKPALALQLKKSGKTQQARKTYKITIPGIKTVESMING